jgi:hypothetical protein
LNGTRRGGNLTHNVDLDAYEENATHEGRQVAANARRSWKDPDRARME